MVLAPETIFLFQESVVDRARNGDGIDSGVDVEVPIFCGDGRSCNRAISG
jgi:hypothetical protein